MLLEGAGELDERVPLHRGLPGDGLLRFSDLLVDSLQDSAGLVGAVEAV